MFGIKVDYFAPTLYLTDLLVLAILTIFVLEKKRPRRLGLEKGILIGVLAILSFSLLNTVFATSKTLSLIKWTKVFELSLLAFYISRQKKLETESWIMSPLIFSGILFSSIGIAQFISQKTLGGALYFLGERTFNASTPGIALGDFFGSFVLRAYSTFSHPNSFAAYLGFLIILAFFVRPKGVWKKIIHGASILSGTIALYLTLSRWVLISLFITFLAIFLKRRVVINIKKTSIWFLGILVTTSLLLPVYASQLQKSDTIFSESLSERLYLAKRAGEMASENPIIGVGLNNFILKLPERDFPEYSWRLQPVHNIFLLVFSETGLVGLLGFIFIVVSTIKNQSKFQNERTAAFTFFALLFILLTGFADHYWLTLQQNQLIFALVIGLGFRKTYAKLTS